MTKLLRKTVFGLPSQAVMERIDASAKAARIREAGYRFEAQLRELERQFDAKARELREGYLSTVDELNARNNQRGNRAR
jgi:chromosome condensin MukBEF MukE localization factor